MKLLQRITPTARKKSQMASTATTTAASNRILQPRTRFTQWKYVVAGLCVMVLILAILMIVHPFLYKEEITIKQRKKKNNRRSRTVNKAKTYPQTTTMAAQPQDATTTISPYLFSYMNPSYMDACYSMRLVVPTYDGPVVKIEKNDGTQQDIYTDATQSFLTLDPHNEGISMAEWLGSGVGKVRVWYDQSGNENHAKCYSYCPIISTLDSSKYVLRFQQYTDSGLRINPVKPNAIFFQFWHDNNDPAKIISTDVDPVVNQYYGVIIQNGNINGSKSQYDWYYVGKGNKDFTVNQDDSPEYDLGQWNTVCLSIDNPDYSADDKENLTLIGKDLSGHLSELILYNRPMDAEDIDDYNKSIFDIED
jgi:hypothetical protein